MLRGSAVRSGAFAATSPCLASWWNYSTEQKSMKMTLMGGVPTNKTPRNAIHRVYVRKFRRGAFPNRNRQHWYVAMNGITSQRPTRLRWPYDLSSMIFNKSAEFGDNIGYVVGTKMLKTVVVAADYMVYYPKWNQKVARTKRIFAHDEDMACVDGDLVHIKMCRQMSKYKKYYVFSILEPNIEGRERMKLGLPAVPPPLFGHPTSRRVVKLNLTTSDGLKKKLAASVQEQVQEFYRFAGSVGSATPGRLNDQGESYEDAARLIAPNAPESESLEGAERPEQLEATAAVNEEFTDAARDDRQNKGEEFWMKQEPSNKYDYTRFTTAP